MGQIGRASRTAGGIGRWRRPLAVLLASTTLGSLLALATAAPAQAAPATAKAGRIAYLVDGDTSTELWIADKDGSNRHRLLDAVSGSGTVKWHPSGGLLAYDAAEVNAPHDAVTDRHEVFTVDADAGQPTRVTSEPEAVTRMEPCPAPPPGCMAPATDYTWDSDLLVDWAPDGTGMLTRRQHHVAFTDGAEDDFSWWRITGAGGVLTDDGHTQTFPGTDDWMDGEPCSDEAIASPLPEILGPVFFLDDVQTDRFAYSTTNTCDGTGTPADTLIDGTPLHVSYPSDPFDEGTSAISTIAPDGRFTVWGPDGFWETTAAGSPTTPLSVTRTTPYPQSFGWVPDPGCYVQLGLQSFDSDVSWSSDRSFAVFAAPGIDLAHPEDAAPYASDACGPDVFDENGVVQGIWKVDPDTRIPQLIIPGPARAPDVECTAGSCLTLLRTVTTAAREDVEDDPQFTYSGAVNGTTGAVTPLGTGGVLSAKVQAGNRTVVAQGATNYVLSTVECDAPSTRTGSSVVVSVVADATTTCTFHYVNGDPDPCTLNPDDCIDSDGDGRTDKAEGKPGVDTDRDGTPDYLDSDSDDDGLPDSTESSNDSDGDGKPDWRDAADKACAPAGAEGRSWVAKTQLAGLPDPEWFQFDIGVGWCKVDGRAEITDLDVVGLTTDGFGSFALGLFGFTPKYLADDLESTWSPGDHDSTAGVTGKFALCFDVLTLADKLKVRKLASSALESGLAKVMQRSLRKTDGLYSPAADAKLLDALDDWARSVRSKLTSLSENLGRAVPKSLRTFLEDKVVAWWDDIASYVRTRLEQAQGARELVGLTPDAVARKVVEDVVGPIWDFAQVCNGLSVWEPAVSVHVAATGPADITIDGYTHPLLTVTQV